MQSPSKTCRMHCGRAHGGFTLVELVTCLVIIGVLAAVAGPRFLDNPAIQQRGYIDEVETAIRYAQRVAIASQCPVAFGVGPSGYQALQQALSGGTCNGAWTVPVTGTDGTALSGSPPSGVLSPTAQFVFATNGSISGGVAPSPLSVGPFTLTIDAGSGLVTCNACK